MAIPSSEQPKTNQYMQILIKLGHIHNTIAPYFYYDSVILVLIKYFISTEFNLFHHKCILNSK